MKDLRQYQSVVLRIKAKDVEAEILKSTTPVLVSFMSSTCSACAKLQKTLETLAKIYSNRLKILTMDTAEAGDFYLKYCNRGTPLTIMFHQGKPVRSKSIVNHDSEGRHEAMWLGSAENIQYFITFLDSCLHAIQTENLN